jgi:hypothetical protein
MRGERADEGDCRLAGQGFAPDERQALPPQYGDAVDDLARTSAARRRM